MWWLGGLDDEARQVKEKNPGADSVTVTMTVESKTAAQVESGAEEIKAQAGENTTLKYMDIQVERTVDGETTKIETTSGLLEIVPLTARAGKPPYSRLIFARDKERRPPAVSQ